MGTGINTDNIPFVAREGIQTEEGMKVVEEMLYDLFITDEYRRIASDMLDRLLCYFDRSDLEITTRLNSRCVVVEIVIKILPNSSQSSSQEFVIDSDGNISFCDEDMENIQGISLHKGFADIDAFSRFLSEIYCSISDGDKKEEPKTPSKPQFQKPKAKLDPKKISEPKKEPAPVKKAAAPVEDLEKQKDHYDKIFAKVKELSKNIAGFPEVSEEDRGGHKWIIIGEGGDVPISITVTKTGLINMRVEPLKHETEFYYLVEEIDLKGCITRISSIPDILAGKEPPKELFTKKILGDASDYGY